MVEAENLQLSNKGLSNIFTYSNDFLFKVGKRSFHCNNFMAQFISPNVAQKLLQDASDNRFEIKVNGPEFSDVFNYFVCLMKGENIKLKYKHTDIFIDICKQLGNLELIEQINSQKNEEISVNNALGILNLKYSLHGDIKNELNFVALHFTHFSQIDLSLLPIDLLFSILFNPNLRIDTEDNLFNFVSKIILKDDKAKYLLGCIDLANLSQENMKKYFLMIKYNEVTFEMWEKICEKFSGQKKARKIIDFPSKPNDPFNGIINHLNQENGGNCCEKEVVSITSSSNSFNSCSDIIDPNFRSSWCTGEHNKSWWMIDFKDSQVEICGYSIKTQAARPGAGHLKNWNLQGSNDLSTWEIIDKQKNNDDINGPSLVHTWTCELSMPYRYIRIITTGRNHKGNKCMYLAGIEFFGNYISNVKTEGKNDVQVSELNKEGDNE